MRRSYGVRVRATAVTALVLAVGLAAGGAVLALAFARARVATVDARLAEQAGQLAGLVRAGSLPATLPVPPGVAAQVLDPDGRVVASSGGTSRVLPLLVGDDRPAAPPGGRDLTTSDSTAGEQRLRVRLQDVDGRTVLLALPLTDVDEAVRGLRRLVLAAVPLLVLAGAGATWLATGAALRPVERLRAAADGVLDARDPPHLPVVPSGDELEALARTLNAMLGRLQAADARQRAFVADAAHELRSPLASALVQLEVAQAAPDGEARDLVDGALVDVERLRRLVEDLLLLARLDAAPPAPAPVDLADLADDAPAPVVVVADPAGVRRAVDGLVANARRHARTAVRTSARADGPHGLLLVEDDGDGVPPQDRERVFERWARLDDARSRDAGGAGLGLAIARAVAEGAGGSLSVDDSPLGGARFTLRLPLAAPHNPGGGRRVVRV